MSDPLYIGIRFALYADLMLLFGLPLFALYMPGPREKALRYILLPASLIGLALSALSIAAMTASMAGVSLLQVDMASIQAMVADTSMGMAWSVRIAALVLLVLVLALSRSVAVPVFFAAISLGTLAWTGHGAAGEGDAGTIQLIGDLIHLLAAAAWLGALVGLGAMLLGRTDTLTTYLALARFAAIGTVIVIAVVASGLVNTAYLIGWANFWKLPTTPYGQLFVVKLALFGAMIGLVAINRFRLTPALKRMIETGETGAAVGALRKSLMIETGAAMAILALVALMGTLQPTGMD